MAFVPLSGEISCWLLIVTMAVTPLMMLFGPLPWLKARRRSLGVASFGYAVLHLLFWLSLIPFVTGWVGENHGESVPVALYGVVLLMCALH